MVAATAEPGDATRLKVAAAGIETSLIETLDTAYVPATGTLYASAYVSSVALRVTRRGPKDAPTSGSDEKKRRTTLASSGTIVATIESDRSSVTRLPCAS